MISYVQTADLWNVGCLHCRYLFCLREAFTYDFYSDDHYVSINNQKMSSMLSFLDNENLLFPYTWIHFADQHKL